ncbi:zonular occludens toxin domain-containing protein [Luteimonas saliphila]|uniref:zonular occludens toxin domain-containing protein n=1 Tax=Luteimonas saliphila TaxID=2804919 RepID=UPI00192DFE33|nr:zonular occludens toxin domain-containing protein [Luteimonas saliphila]
MTNALGKTASITLLTGLPGSGKTLRVVHYIKQALEEGEVIFVSNLNGLKLPHVPFEDPREWRDLPPGSVLIVDEAQKFFRARRSGEPPRYLTDMETIRHDGVRLILTTQQPDYLDTHLRGLVGLHEHLLREGGGNKVQIFRHNEVMDNVRSKKARSAYDSEVWEYPADLYDCYQSAEVHTVKKVMSARMKRGMVMAGAAAVLFGGVIAFVTRDAAPSKDDASSGSEAGSRSSAAAPAGRAKEEPKLSAVEKHEAFAKQEYFANLQPREPMLPWSRPIFDDRAAVSDPRLFCMTGGEGLDAQGEYKSGGFTCLTEQGTRVVLTEAQATLVARQGEAYNPFRRAEHVQAQTAPPGPAVPAGGPAPARAGETIGGSVGTAPAPMVDASFGTITRGTP